jgi:hypothetical protein
MSELKTAAQQALEAMRRGVPTGDITLVDWHRAISALDAALEQREQENPTRQMPEWMDYDQATDVLTIHGRRYSAAMFGERGFLSPAGTLLQVAEGQPDCVTLMTVAALEQPEQDTDCHAQGICQRSGYSIKQPDPPASPTPPPGAHP